MTNPALEIALELADRATAPLKKSLSSIEGSVVSLDQRMGRVSSTVTALGAAFGGWQVAQAVGGVVNLTDKYSLLESRLSLVTGSTEELDRVQSKLYKTANATFQAYESTATSYTNFTRATKELALSEERRIGITSSLNKAMVVSGATQEQSARSSFQLNQAMQGGVVRAEEYNSILEQTPRVLEAVADGLGITMGELRRLMLDQKLTAELFIAGFENGAGKVDAEFEKMTRTVGQAKIVFANTFQAIINDGGQSASITETLSAVILDMAGYLEENRESLTAYFKVAVEGFATLIESGTTFMNLMVEIDELLSGKEHGSVKALWADQQVQKIEAVSVALEEMRASNTPGKETYIAKMEQQLTLLQATMDVFQAENSESIVDLMETGKTAGKTAVEIGNLKDKVGELGKDKSTCKWAKETAKCFDGVKKSALETGKSYDVMVAEWVAGKDVLTKNIIDQSDLLAPGTIDAINSELDKMFQAEVDGATETNANLVQLQELLVNDLGRIGAGYFEDILSGQLRTGEEMFDAFFKNVAEMGLRMFSQFAANSVVDALFGAGESGGMTLGGALSGLFSGSGTGAVGTAATGVSIASAAGKISEWASNAGQYVAEALGLATPVASYGVLAADMAAGSAASGASIYAASQAAAPAAFSVVPAGSYAGVPAVAAPSAGVGAGASLAPLGMIAIPAIVAATLSFMSTGSSMAIQEITSASGRDLSLTAFGSTRGEAESKYSDPYWVRAQVGVVSQYGVNTIGDMGSMRDVYTGMSDTIHGIFKAMRTDLDELAAASEGGGGQIEAITDSIATLGDKLEDTYTAMEIKATEYGDSVAALGLQMNQGVKEFDAFADAATGFDFSMDQSSWMMEQASLAADDNADAYNRLYQSLIGVTGSTEAAIEVTGNMVAAMNELSKVQAPTVSSGSTSRPGYHPSNPAAAYSENTSAYVPPAASPPASGGRSGYHPNNPTPDRREEKLIERVVKAVSDIRVNVNNRVAVELDGRAVDARAKNVITKYVARKVGDGRVV